MNEEIISELVQRIRRSDRLYQLISYLKSKGIAETEIDNYINSAKIKIKEEKVKSLPRKNKITFTVFSVISLITLIVYLFVLPKMGFHSITFIAIIGAIVFSTFSILTIIYFNSWKEENVKQEVEIEQNDNGWLSILFVLVPIPAVIFSFIFSYVLESGEDNFLKETQIEVEGVIIGGSSNTIGVRRGNVNFSSVSVEFLTKEGEKIVATEDVTEYEFNDFYKGQKVKLIYSSEDPQIIELLTNKRAISKFKDSEERDFKATDLLTLFSANENETLPLLNKITYGWEYDPSIESYKNNAKGMLFVKGSNEIVLTTNDISMYKLPREFLELDFKDITAGGIGNPMTQKNRSFENDDYFVSIERSIIGSQRFVSTTISKK